MPEKPLAEYMGRNERTRATVKLQKKGQGAPSREPVSITCITFTTHVSNVPCQQCRHQRGGLDHPLTHPQHNQVGLIAAGLDRWATVVPKQSAILTGGTKDTAANAAGGGC
jgi:hypothetical protein